MVIVELLSSGNVNYLCGRPKEREYFINVLKLVLYRGLEAKNV